MSSMTRSPPAMASAGPSTASPASSLRWQDTLSSSPELQALEERRARLAAEYPRARREPGDGKTGEGHGQAEVLRTWREVDYLCAHHAQLHCFLADVLPRLARVADTRGALDFHEWEMAFCGAAPASLTLELRGRGQL